jgi:hypothetical protein
MISGLCWTRPRGWKSRNRSTISRHKIRGVLRYGQQCYDLVTANMNEDDVLGYVLHDLIHYTGTRLFRSAPMAKDFSPYRPEFRDVATALRSAMSLADYRKNDE